MTTAERAKEIVEQWGGADCARTLLTREVAALLDLLVEARGIVATYAWRQGEGGLRHPHPLIERIDKVLEGPK